MTYKQKYLKHFGYGEQDWTPCERCGKTSIEVHHIIYRSQGGPDDITNLCGLCRECHDLAHAEKLSKTELQLIHNKFMTINIDS